MKPTHELYAGEVEECAGIQSMADCKPLDDSARRAVECAYRRGFFQGAATALDAFGQSSAPALEAWLHNQLHDWRFLRSHNGQMEPPPSPPTEYDA